MKIQLPIHHTSLPPMITSSDASAGRRNRSGTLELA
jgi:hypothetical protein